MNNQNEEFKEEIKEENKNQTIINNTISIPQQKNTMGLVGFILSLVNIAVSFFPLFGFVVWLLGAIFSIIGLFKAPRGFAIAGTIISFIWLIVFFIAVLLLGTVAILAS